jgi:hypothetical protein
MNNFVEEINIDLEYASLSNDINYYNSLLSIKDTVKQQRLDGNFSTSTIKIYYSYLNDKLHLLKMLMLQTANGTVTCFKDDLVDLETKYTKYEEEILKVEKILQQGENKCIKKN